MDKLSDSQKCGLGLFSLVASIFGTVCHLVAFFVGIFAVSNNLGLTLCLPICAPFCACWYLWKQCQCWEDCCSRERINCIFPGLFIFFWCICGVLFLFIASIVFISAGATPYSVEDRGVAIFVGVLSFFAMILCCLGVGGCPFLCDQADQNCPCECPDDFSPA